MSDLERPVLGIVPVPGGFAGHALRVDAHQLPQDRRLAVLGVEREAGRVVAIPVGLARAHPVEQGELIA